MNRKLLWILFLFGLPVSCRPLEYAVTEWTVSPSASAFFISSNNATIERTLASTLPAPHTKAYTPTGTDTLTPTSTLTAMNDPFVEETNAPTSTRRASSGSETPCYDFSTLEIASTSGWNVFLTQDYRWMIRYPLDWKPFSCTMCPDPTAPGMMVYFGPHNSALYAEGVIEMSGYIGVAEKDSEEFCTINDRPARKVRYRYKNGDMVETIYKLFGATWYGMTFGSAHKEVEQVEDLANYEVFQLMALNFEWLAV